MVQLLDDVGALGVHGIGDRAEPGDDGVVGVPEVPAGEHAGGVDGHGLDDDHRRPAACPFAVVPEVLLGGETELAHVGGVGPEDDPVAQREVPQLEWLSEMCVPPGHVGEGSTGGRLVRSCA